MSTDIPAVISASPRPGGNSDRAATLFAQGVAQAGGARPRVTHLRRFDVHPCQACYRCKHDANGRCFLGEIDQSGALFQMLLDAPYVFLSAPIFFYHLPAQLKSWVDRSQSYWLRKLEGDEALAALPVRPAYVCLVAGRKHGDKLFEGSLLTLKYFLDIFNFKIVDPLTLYGLDGAGELAVHSEFRDALVDLGAHAATRVLAGGV